MKQSEQKPVGKKDGLQLLLPLFPAEATLINNLVGVQMRGGMVYYFNGSMPVFMHRESDMDGFRYITSQMIVNGSCKPKEIVSCFGVSNISVKRWVKRYKESKELSAFVSKKKSPAIISSPAK
jgi:hypothetical protein